MKACCECKYGVDDEEGTYCGVDWDSLEYRPPSERQAVINECEAAKMRKMGL